MDSLCEDIKNVWKSDRHWEPENFENLKTWKLENFENIKNDPWDMLNNFCFHVYAQKSLFKVENVNGFFLTSMVFFWQNFMDSTLSCFFPFLELVPS